MSLDFGVEDKVRVDSQGTGTDLALFRTFTISTVHTMNTFQSSKVDS